MPFPAKNGSDIDLICPVNWLDPLNDGLFGWWLALPWFGGGSIWHDLTDLSIGYHGTLTDMVPTDDWVPTDRIGGFAALTFDASDDFIDFGAIPEFSFGTGPFSICASIKTNDSTGGIQIINQENTAGTDDNFAFKVQPTSGVLRTEYAAAAVATGTIDLQDDQWHSVCVVRDNSGNVTQYVDGVEDGTGTNTGSISSTKRVVFGQRDVTGTQFWNGQADDIRFWSRPLNPSEAADCARDTDRRYPRTLRRVSNRVLNTTAAGDPEGPLIGGKLIHVGILTRGRLVG